MTYSKSIYIFNTTVNMTKAPQIYLYPEATQYKIGHVLVKGQFKPDRPI